MSDGSQSASPSWLLSEALLAEERAVEFDRCGSIPEALHYYHRSQTKLNEAADLCGPGHPDQAMLLDYAGDISLRAVYLASLGGAPAKLPLEEHLGSRFNPAALSELNPAAALAPPAQAVAALVVSSGVSGATAALSDAGYNMVLALCSREEIEAYCRRLLDADWRQLRQQDGSPELSALCRQCCEGAAPESLEALREKLRHAQWVEIRLLPGQDRLEVAVALEKEARTLDQQGLAKSPEAIMAYHRAAAVMQLVLRFDARAKNPKVEKMLTDRLNDLKGRAAELEATSGSLKQR